VTVTGDAGRDGDKMMLLLRTGGAAVSEGADISFKIDEKLMSRDQTHLESYM